MKTTTFYIGADNHSGQVNIDKIVSLVSEWFGGGTIVPTTGVWQGQQEQSVMVIVGHDKDVAYIQAFCARVCQDLSQSAIGVQHANGVFEIVDKSAVSV